MEGKRKRVWGWGGEEGVLGGGGEGVLGGGGGGGCLSVVMLMLSTFEILSHQSYCTKLIQQRKCHTRVCVGQCLQARPVLCNYNLS